MNFSLANDLGELSKRCRTSGYPQIWMISQFAYIIRYDAPSNFLRNFYLYRWRRGIFLIQNCIEFRLSKQPLKYGMLQCVEVSNSGRILGYCPLKVWQGPYCYRVNLKRIKHVHRYRIRSLVCQMAPNPSPQHFLSLTNVDWLIIVVKKRIDSPLDRTQSHFRLTRNWIGLTKEFCKLYP